MKLARKLLALSVSALFAHAGANAFAQAPGDGHFPPGNDRCMVVQRAADRRPAGRN